MKNKLFQQFLKEYLDNVERELPESYRARQLKNGGIQAGLVYEFETRFLKQPFIEAIQEAKKEVFDDIEKDKRLCITSVDMWNDLKKRHLSTFPKEKQHN